MQECANVSVVRDAYRAFREGNIDVLLECLADHVKWFASGPPDQIPSAGTSYGPDQIDRYFSIVEKLGEVTRFEPQEFIAQDNKVVAIGELQAEVKATGSRIRSPWVHVFTLQRGKISEFRSVLRHGCGYCCARTAGNNRPGKENQNRIRRSRGLLNYTQS